ncbi:MAG: GGDEF domain-containing protein [Proteobacteria bacterium]|nr:GGDEF domain-containing protein [Pseudomonadota bacterium]
MSLQGPIVVVADTPVPALVGALSGAGAFPVVETPAIGAQDAIQTINPAAIVLAQTGNLLDLAACCHATGAQPPAYRPVLALTPSPSDCLAANILPISDTATPERIIARLASALRVRTLAAAAARRVETLRAAGEETACYALGDPLEDATVLLVGRGRIFPDLSVAVGERTGVVGALSLESAVNHLNAREVNGVMIGDGLSARALDAFFAVLASDARFRDLPVAVVASANGAGDPARLANMEIISGSAREVVAHFLPLVGQNAFAAQITRVIAAAEARGLIDTRTGLFTTAHFLRELRRAIVEAGERAGGLSIARFSFAQSLGRRRRADAARLVSRLVRGSDFACATTDGSILVAFAETGLASAHVISRRIASVLKHTMLSAAETEARPQASITLATLKGDDTIESLIVRVNDSIAVAAG